MKISLELSRFITEQDEKMLGKVLRADNGDIMKSLEQIGSAAVEEYLEMVLGKQLPTRADEIRQRRLFHLLKHYFVARIPDDVEVASLFQLTENAGRSLLKATLTKFRFELEAEILNTIQYILSSAERKDDSYHAVVRSETILDEMKRTISIKAPQLKQIGKVRNSAEVYEFPDDTFEVLCAHYGVNRAAKEAAATEAD